jgi:prolyl-tRNA synthetase
MVAQGEAVIVMLRGDHQLNLNKLARVLGTEDIRPAGAEETLELMGANFGSLGPVSVNGIGVKARIIADQALEGRRGMVSGANKDGFHLAGLEPGRDFQARFVDVRTVNDGELAPDGSGRLEIKRGLELGHIFKLGTTYTQPMGVQVQGADGKRVPLVMGSYGIGVERLMSAIAETHNDAAGLKLPPSVAPFAVTVLELGDTNGKAREVYDTLRARGLEVLLDDRADARAGEKFAEFELMGIPTAVVVGKKSLETGMVEIRKRLMAEKLEVRLEELSACLE